MLTLLNPCNCSSTNCVTSHIVNPIKGYLQPLDLLYNAGYNLKFKLEIEDYLVGLHMKNETLRVTDEKAAEIATKVYYEMSSEIIQEKSHPK